MHDQSDNKQTLWAYLISVSIMGLKIDKPAKSFSSVCKNVYYGQRKAPFVTATTTANRSMGFDLKAPSSFWIYNSN